MGKRPAYQQRVASWSDSRSAWSDKGSELQEDETTRRKRVKLGRSSTMLSGMEEEEGVGVVESDVLYESDLDVDKKVRSSGVRRYVHFQCYLN